jgi:diguanylate cyclase (GGDEF)-like protein/PAS domain S-box-containing protein
LSLGHLKRGTSIFFISTFIVFILNFILIVSILDRYSTIKDEFAKLSQSRFNINSLTLKINQEFLTKENINSIAIKNIDLPQEYINSFNKFKHSPTVESLRDINESNRIIVKNLNSLINLKDKEYKDMIANMKIYIMVIFLLSVIFLILFYTKWIYKSLKKMDKIYSDLENYINILDDKIIISKTDIKGKILYASRAFCDISGFSIDELIGKPHSIVRHKDMPKEAFEDLWNTIQKGKTWQGEVKNRKKDGGFYWVLATASPVFDKDGNITGYTSIRQDITQKKEMERLSITDELTSLYNRRYFNDVAPKMIKDIKAKNEEVLALVIIDVDNFKKYNDTYGHQKGDEVLVKVAKVLRDNKSVMSFRLGGEEFGVLISNKNKELIFDEVETLRKSIEELNIEHKNNDTVKVVTASFGVYILTQESNRDNFDVGVMYKIADEELYRAKESGRNRVCIEVD